MVMEEFRWMKTSGITWVELERKRGIAAGLDFTEGWDCPDIEFDSVIERLPIAIGSLAQHKRWSLSVRDKR